MSDNGEPVVIIRPSFKKITSGDSCRAAAYNHILYWIARKWKQGTGYWYSSGEDLHSDLADTWSINIIRREVKALVDMGLLGEMKNPIMGIDRTKHFYFHKEQAHAFFTACAQHGICYRCLGLPMQITDLLNAHFTDLLNATKNRQFEGGIYQICAMHLPDLLHPFNKSVGAITQVSTQVSFTERGTFASSAHATDARTAHAENEHTSQESETPDASGNMDSNAGVVDSGRPPLQHTAPVSVMSSVTDVSYSDGATPSMPPGHWLPEEPPLIETPSHYPHEENGFSTAGVDTPDGDETPTQRMPVVRPRFGLPCKPQEKGHDDDAVSGDLANKRGADGSAGLAVPVLRGDALGDGVAHAPGADEAGEGATDGQSNATMSFVGREENGNTQPPHPNKTPTNPTIPVAKGKRTRSGKTERPAKPVEPPPAFTDEGLLLWQAWCSIFKAAPLPTKSDYPAANELVAGVTVWEGLLSLSTKELLDKIRRWLHANDRNGYYSRGVKLFDVSREFGAWQEAAERKMEEDGRKASGANGSNGNGASSVLAPAEIRAARIERYKREIAARQALGTTQPMAYS